ncbi:HAMP domain-containing sensor histidine kinase [Spirosoma utsteinense]|uniref:histidine kinase n=1 Tax=Spirosoma utsteinense TaxID=2585773 RepID=A0ABR6W8N2_9BACT|nr:HAMP domain-containing sensor histidine kinase [Spirosoma utsteinense]MBC3787250.1 signal transduction histidine kinase [Spirosoma utsteinense]MBC3792936.1 signal transduction histidine kinase [Spirosoma utsteinense]
MLIRNRLTLIFTLLATAIQLTLSLLVWYFYSLYRQEEFYSRLESKARVAGRVLISRRHLHDDFFRNMVRTDLLTIVEEQISIYDNRHKLVFTNRTLKESEYYKEKIPLLAADPLFEFKSGHLESIVIPFRDRGQLFYIFASGYDRIGFAKLGTLQQIMLLANLLGFALIVLAGWYFSGRVLNPISQIVDEVEQITATHLYKRVNEGNQRDEIAQLAMTFNQMLFRLEDAFVSQRSFVSHASHELRTPLTNTLGTLETSLRYDRNPADWRDSMEIAVEELKKVISLTNGLLGLAKVTDGAVALTVVQVDDCLLTAIGQVQSKYPGRNLPLQFSTDDEQLFTVKGNATLLTTAFLNVLDNACKYSDEAVAVQLQVQQELISVIVTDRGRGISEADAAHILDPLYRGENVAGVPGYGIGLAVTQKIIDLHQGTLHITSHVNQGTTVTIQLPSQL